MGEFHIHSTPHMQQRRRVITVKQNFSSGNLRRVILRKSEVLGKSSWEPPKPSMFSRLGVRSHTMPSHCASLGALRTRERECPKFPWLRAGLRNIRLASPFGWPHHSAGLTIRLASLLGLSFRLASPWINNIRSRRCCLQFSSIKLLIPHDEDEDEDEDEG